MCLPTTQGCGSLHNQQVMKWAESVCVSGTDMGQGWRLRPLLKTQEWSHSFCAKCMDIL